MELLRKLLFPFSLLYALVVRVRNWFYDMGIFKSKSYSTTTICIGNLSVGGTGKTPMTELLVRSLRSNYKLAILSRGYRRSSSGFVLANAETTVTEIGDEPFQMFSKFPETTVVVDSDRRNGIERLQQDIKPDIILLDDAFQHRKVKPHFSILLTAYDKLYTDDWYLPTGDLRDNRYAAHRASIIIVTKCPPDLSVEVQKSIKKKLGPKPQQTVLFTYLSYTITLKGAQDNLDLSYFKGKKVTLVTGISNPAPLATYLTQCGLSFEHLAYNDHHFFTKKEIELFKTKQNILTTEKDYTRLKDLVDNVLFIPVEHRFLSDGKAILEGQLNELMKKA